jgi:fatty-acyl-CoA synthase
MPPLTLVEALQELPAVDRWGLVFLREGGVAERVSFAELMRRALRVQAGLQALGLGAGERVGLVVEDKADFIGAFVACVLAGAVPVPLPGPSPTTSRTVHAGWTTLLLRAARADAVIASRTVLGELPRLRVACAVEDLPAMASTAPWPVPAAPEDTCFLQFTSGSTGSPKAVIVTHASLLANARAIAQALDLDARRDIGLNWLPLHHDMGLVGNVLTALIHQIPSSTSRRCSS